MFTDVGCPQRILRVVFNVQFGYLVVMALSAVVIPKCQMVKEGGGGRLIIHCSGQPPKHHKNRKQTTLGGTKIPFNPPRYLFILLLFILCATFASAESASQGHPTTLDAKVISTPPRPMIQ